MFSQPVDTRVTHLSWGHVERRWRQLAGNVRERWSLLTDNDIAKIAGDRRLLIGKIQERYGIITDQAERQVDDWLNEMGKTGPV